MSLSNTGIDRFLQQNYYSKTQLNAGQLDSRYYAESEFLATSAGAGDAGKPVKLNGSGALDATLYAASVVTLTGTQTLTNKTLTAPVISTISNTGTLTLPTSTDTLVGRATTDTLTNKTLTAPVISTISNTGTLTLPTSTDTLVGRATTDTLTNKTLTAPTITNPTVTGVETVAASLYSGGSFSAHTAAKAMNVWGAGTDGTRFWAAALGMNVYWDGTNWKVGGDGSTNGGVLFLAQGTGADWSTYTFPSTGTTAQIIAPGSLSTYLRSTVNDSAVPVTTSGTQTLTAKTLTAPVISTISNTGTLTLPTSTDTLVGRATTDTLTNKTISDGTMSTSMSVTGTSTFAGSVSETALSSDNIRIGVIAGLPRIMFEDNGSTQWGIDNSAGALRFITPGVVQATISSSGVLAVIGSITAGGVAVPTISSTSTLTNKTITDPLISRVYGGSAANDDLTIEGTSSATKTSSYVILQPSGGNTVVGGLTTDHRFEVQDAGASNYRITMNLNVSGVNYLNSYSAAPGTLTAAPLTLVSSALGTTGDTFRIETTKTPTGAGAGSAGQIAWDTGFLYICTASNVWKRVALSAF